MGEFLFVVIVAIGIVVAMSVAAGAAASLLVGAARTLFWHRRS